MVVQRVQSVAWRTVGTCAAQNFRTAHLVARGCADLAVNMHGHSAGTAGATSSMVFRPSRSYSSFARSPPGMVAAPADKSNALARKKTDKNDGNLRPDTASSVLHLIRSILLGQDGKVRQFTSLFTLLRARPSSSRKAARVIRTPRHEIRPAQGKQQFEGHGIGSSPPSRSPNSGSIAFGMIVAANVTVFLMWAYSKYQIERYKDYNFADFMVQNFMCSIVSLREGRYWTLLSSCISHQSFSHLLINMVSFFFFGPSIVALVGAQTFIRFYFLAGLASCLCSLAFEGATRKPVPGQDQHCVYRLGASGSVIACLTAFSCVFPRATLTLFFVIPAPAYVLVPGLLAYDLWSALSESGAKFWFNDTMVDSAGHVGGTIAGVIFWLLRLRGFRAL